MIGKSSTELVRQANSVLVLSQMRRSGPLAHTEISEETGLSSATVSAITNDLEERGIIERLEQQAPGGRGRPRVLFSQRRACGFLAVAIVSSDTIEYSLVDYGGMLIDRFSEPRGRAEAAAFLAQIEASLWRLAGRSSLRPADLLCLSISSKGLVHPDRPVLLWSPLLGSKPIDFADALGSFFANQILLSNETLLVAGALHDRLQGKAACPMEGLAALSLGHSIGLGVVRDGASGEPEITAPNFGHMLHIPDGALCRCGASGCVEAYAGFYAILRNAFGVPLNTIPAKFVPLAEAGVAIGNGLSRLLSLYGHMPVFVTGYGTQHFDLLQAGVEEGLSQSQVVRLGGMPQIDIVADERALVFEGHLKLAFSLIDRDIIRTGKPMQAAGE
eukprot:g7647.t1